MHVETQAGGGVEGEGETDLLSREPEAGLITEPWDHDLRRRGLTN